MAEPLAIIGLVSSIITFIEFGSKLVSTVKSIRENPEDPIPGLGKLQQTRTHIRHLKSAFEKGHDEILPPDIEDILLIARSCDTVANNLENVFTKFKPKDKTFGRMEALNMAIHSIYQRKPIETLQSDLEKLDTKLRAAVHQVLQQRQHSALMEEIGMLRRSCLNMAVNYDDSLDSYQSEILSLTSSGSYNVLDTKQLEGLNQRLVAFEQECKDRRHTARVLSRLNFPEIRRRWDGIDDTEDNTNRWIFHRTDFLEWLESGSDIFWITGKAGSGKSTLMKFISDHARTRQALKVWADQSTLHITSYYFWNQGSPLQKSLKGLLRTVLFLILKTSPKSVTKVCPTLPEGDWTERELKEILRRLTELGDVQAKFCFFIDGLDEFSGDETELRDVISFFSESRQVKLCVSSRPRIILDEAFLGQRRSLTISDYTLDDMKHFVRIRFRTEKFKKLQEQPGGREECERIMTKIAETSKGVWLWVYLVTHDLVNAIEGNEQIQMLHKILKTFPEELEKYFEFIIDKVRPPFREQMGQIFLITIDEVQPLPVFVFSLLEREMKNARYAIEAPIEPLDIESIKADDKGMKARLHNRCKDLLVVEDGSHPVVLSHPVDFLHRTVRDFLRDCYYEELKHHVNEDFHPLISLCNMMLFLVKSLPLVKMNQPRSITQLFQIIDELLYYANEIEKRDPSQAALDHVASVLDELDRVNTVHHWQKIGCHWTSIRDPPRTRGNDEYREGRNCNFLALAVQARLTKYVRAKLDRDPNRFYKPGRPLLDYALRPRRVTSLIMPYHSQRDETGVDMEMVSLLLDRGASPNEPVHLNDGKTVWALFLVSIHESSLKDDVSTVTKQVWYNICELLIRHSADSSCRLTNDWNLTLNMDRLLTVVFDDEKARVLQRLMADEKSKQKSSWMSVIVNPVRSFWW